MRKNFFILFIVFLLINSLSFSVCAMENGGGYEPPAGGRVEMEAICADDDEVIFYDTPVIYALEGSDREQREYWSRFSSKYYYEQLSEVEKDAWDSMLAMCFDMTEGSMDAVSSSYGGYYTPAIYVDSSLRNESDALRLSELFIYSNPQFYFLGSRITYGSSSGKAYYRLQVYDDFADGGKRAEATLKFKEAVDNYMGQINADNYPEATEAQIHDILISNTDYNTNADLHQSAWSIFIDKQTVCAGYCKGFELLSNAFGIECIPVIGYANGNHAWNMVKLYGFWYVVDCTWDDPSGSDALNYTYFNKSDKSAAGHYAYDGQKYGRFNVAQYLPTAEYDSTTGSGRNYVSGYLMSDDYVYFKVSSLGPYYLYIVDGRGGADIKNAPDMVEYENRDFTVINSSDKSYAVTYFLDDGVNAHENTDVYYPMEGLELKEPSKFHYKFDGWFRDENYKNEIKAIPQGTVGNINLYAKWSGHHVENEPVVENVIPASYEVDGSYDEVIYCSIGGEELRRSKKNIENLKAARERKIRAFVERMYTCVLQRTKDEKGIDFWTGLLADNMTTGLNIGYDFVFSREFRDKNLSDAEYINILYSAFMDREADDGGMEYWLDILSVGFNREYVFMNFVQSEEFADVCEDYGIVLGSAADNGEILNAFNMYRNKNRGVTGYVTRCYRMILERQYDDEGIEYWCEQILTGGQPAQVVAESFVISDEFVFRNVNDEAYLDILYNTFFDRKGDANGVEYWLAGLKSGDITRTHALECFSQSEEFDNIKRDYGLN